MINVILMSFNFKLASQNLFFDVSLRIFMLFIS